MTEVSVYNYIGLTAQTTTATNRCTQLAAKGLVSGIDKMRPEYYKVRGWTPEGVPTKETLDRLGL